MKRRTIYFLIVIMGLLGPNHLQAQSANDLLRKLADGDTIGTKSELLRKYQSSDSFGQRALRQDILNQLEQELTNENAFGSINLASLYLHLADSNDVSVPVVLYILGENYAKLGDTLHLKSSITELEGYSRRSGDSLVYLLNPLYDYLTRYRNAVPTTESLEGFWISDFVMDTKNIEFVGAPYMLMRIRNVGDSVGVEISPYSFITTTIRNDVSSAVSSTKCQYSQIVKPFGKDSLYICWSSSRIVHKSDIGVTMLRATTSEISSNVVAKYSQRNKYSFSEQLAASAITSIVEVGVNALLDEIFMPKKKDYVLQARLRVVNEFVLEGTIHYSSTVLRADGRANNKEYVKKMKFLRWKPESNIVFSNHNRRPILPDDRDVKKYNKDTSTYFSYAFSLPKRKTKDYVFKFNLLQLRRLGIYDDILLREQNIIPTGIYNLEDVEETRAIVGISYVNVTPEIKKKYFLHSDSGVMVTDIFKGLPAYFSPLHKGDVILSVDGTAVNDSVDFSTIKLHIGKVSYFKIKRGSKDMTIKIEPTLYFVRKKKND